MASVNDLLNFVFFIYFSIQSIKYKIDCKGYE